MLETAKFTDTVYKKSKEMMVVLILWTALMQII